VTGDYLNLCDWYANRDIPYKDKYSFMVHALLCSTTFSSCSSQILEHVFGMVDMMRWNSMACSFLI